MSEELEVQASQQVEVMIALARMEGQLTAVLSLVSTQGEALTNVTGDVSQLRDRVTTLEATRSATPPWWTVLGVVVPTLGFMWLVAEKLFAK